MDYLAEAKKFGGSPISAEPSGIDYLSAAKEFGGTPVQENKPINYLDAAKEFGGTPLGRTSTEPNPFAEEAQQQQETPKEKAKEEKHWYDFLTEEATARHDIAKKVGEDVFVATKNTPVQAKAAVAAALEGNDPNVIFGEKDWKDSTIEEARKLAKEERGFKGAEEEYLLGITREKLRNLPQNLSFSLVSMGAGLAAGIPAAFATTPVGGYIAGAGASGLAAYRMDTNGFLRDLREQLDTASEKTTGKPLTDEQFIKIAKNYESMVREHGLWEALPEALGNVIGAKLGAALFKEAAPGIKGLLADVAKVGGQFINELGTETITQTGQHNVEIDAGMSKEPKRSFTDIDDLKKSAQEVLPDVLLLTGVTTGGAKAAGVAYRETDFAKKRELARAIEEDVAARSFSREGIQEEAARRMAGRAPIDIAAIARSMDQQQAQPPVAPPEQPPEPLAEEAPPTAQPTTFSEENLVAMGIGKTNKKIRNELIGKDLNNPDEREEVRTILETYAQNPKLSEGIRTKVEQFLSSPIMSAEVATVTPDKVDRALATPKLDTMQVTSLEGDFAEVQEDVEKAFSSGRTATIPSAVGELSVVALEDPNENGELFLSTPDGNIIGSVFFSKYEAQDGTRFEPTFNVENSYRSPEFDAAIYDLMDSLGAVYPQAEEVVSEEAKPEEDMGFQDIEAPSRSDVAERSTRSPSFKTKVKKINKQLQEGRISEGQHTALITQAIEDDFNKDKTTQRARGALEIRKRLIAAAQQGALSEEDLGLAEWFVNQNPALFDDLGLSLRQPTKYEQGVSGHYDPFARVFTALKKPNIRGETVIHEMLHHMERMMPVEVQREITKAWSKSFMAAKNKAEKGTDEDLKNFFQLLYNFHFIEDLSSSKQMRAAMNMIKDGKVDYEFYQYVNPSEFWAVNSTRIVENRYNLDQGVINKLKRWLAEFAQKLKSMFGLPSDAPLIRALDSLSKSDGKFKSSAMLAQSEGYFMLDNNRLERKPTPAAKDALDELENLGMGARPDAPGLITRMSSYVTDAVSNPSGTAQEAREAYTRFIDSLGTKIFSTDRALNNNLRRAIEQAGVGKEEAIGFMINTSLSQTNHPEAVATNHILYGNSKWNSDLLKWEAINDDDAKLATLARQTDEMAQAHGLTNKQAKLIAQKAFEARRLQGLQNLNDSIREQMRDAYDQGNVKEANRLRRKLKYVHMTPEQMDYALSLFDKFPELENIDKTWNNQRKNAAKVLVDTGLWTEEEADDLLSISDYVPFYREKPEEADVNPKGFLRGLQVQAKERKLRGSDLAVANIFDNMAQWTQYAINRGVRNRSTLALLDGLSEFGMAEKVSRPEKAKNLVRAWRDGNQEYWNVTDPMFIPAFRGLESVALPTFKVAAAFSSTLRDTVVMFPLFTIAQVPADSYTAMLSSGLAPKHAFKIPFLAAKEFGKTLFGISKTHERLRAVGAAGVKDFQSAIALKEAEIEAGLLKEAGLTKQILSAAKRGLKHFAMAGDNAVRQAVYEASMQAGLSEAEAIEKAFNVIHFRNMGTNPLLRMGGQTIPFFNAYLAAMDVTVKTITGVGISPSERAEARKTFIYMNAAVMTLSFLYAMANGDDEDYLKKPTLVRDRLLMLPGSGGFSIPLRKDFFLLPKLAGEHLYLLLTDKGFEDGRKIRDSIASWAASSVFSPTLLPQMFKTSIEVAFNHDFFMNRDLVPYYQSKMQPWRQFNESTSELGKLVGRSNMISPIGFDHLIRGYFGSVGGLMLVITNKLLHSDPEVQRPEMTFREVLNSIPGTSSFISKPSENSLKTDFYILQEECNKAAMTLKDIENRSPSEIREALKDKDFVMRASMAKDINKIGRELGEIRKYIAYVSNAPDSQYSPEKKREEIQKMRDLEWRVLKNMDVKRLRAMANL